MRTPTWGEANYIGAGGWGLGLGLAGAESVILKSGTGVESGAGSEPGSTELRASIVRSLVGHKEFRVRRLFLSSLVLVLCAAATIAAPASAQQSPTIIEADPGVRAIRMIDRAEVRASRVELQPGATRRVHTHEDVVYHLWIPIEGTLEITIGGAAPVSAASGQAFFMVKGTIHGFRNTGTSPAAALEIFIKTITTAANPLPWELLAQLNVSLTPSAVPTQPR